MKDKIRVVVAMPKHTDKAIHEAGHAVIARKLDVEVAFVSMKPTADYNSGAVRTYSAEWRARHSDAAARVAAAEKDCMVALAGMVAQKVAAREEGKEFPSSIPEFEHDLVRIGRLCVVIVKILAGEDVSPDGRCGSAGPLEGEAVATYHRLLKQVSALVAQHWLAIKRVAKALEWHDRIDQAELDRLIAVAERDIAR